IATLGGEAILYDKLDGFRVQVHYDGAHVGVFTRTLEDITDRVPNLVARIAALPMQRTILDGEVLLMGSSGRPRPFQETSARIASGTDTSELSVYFFDVLTVDGRDLIDQPATLRFAELVRLIPDEMLVERLVVSDEAQARRFFEHVLAAGHEGVVAKSPEASYEAGRRGAGWIKVKPVHTLDLVVLAVEWGSGRRSGKLSNIHLGARSGDDFVMLGKTFKGMTDEMLTWQTEHFLELQTGRAGHVLHLRPEQVVEIAFDGLQRSTRYPGGVALRFARVVRYRHDKTAAEASTLSEVLEFVSHP
ncbi:MAG: ATP-dependent DNA ligase, partial [Arachnia sp.]